MVPSGDKYRDFVVDTIKAAGQELIDRADSMVNPNMILIGDVRIDISIKQNCFPTLSISIETPISHAKEVFNKIYK